MVCEFYLHTAVKNNSSKTAQSPAKQRPEGPRPRSPPVSTTSSLGFHVGTFLSFKTRGKGTGPPADLFKHREQSPGAVRRWGSAEGLGARDGAAGGRSLQEPGLPEALGEQGWVAAQATCGLGSLSEGKSHGPGLALSRRHWWVCLRGKPMKPT